MFFSLLHFRTQKQHACGHNFGYCFDWVFTYSLSLQLTGTVFGKWGLTLSMTCQRLHVTIYKITYIRLTLQKKLSYCYKQLTACFVPACFMVKILPTTTGTAWKYDRQADKSVFNMKMMHFSMWQAKAKFLHSYVNSHMQILFLYLSNQQGPQFSTKWGSFSQAVQLTWFCELSKF